MAKITLDNPTTVSPNCPTLPDNAQAVTPSDTDTFSQAASVWAGVAGNISVIPAGSGPAITVPIAAGGLLPFKVLQVRSTGTTATSILVVY